MGTVRQPAVAGTFYPADPQQLEGEVLAYLAGAETPSGSVPKAIIAPHAGYVYSGPIAANAYARLAPARGRIRRVVLIGPSHRVPFRGMAVTTAQAYATPLGEIPIDRDAVAALLRVPGVAALDAAHGPEHSLEVHLPFLQKLLGSFALVPIVAGDADPDTVADALEAVWGGDETAIVVSSDLSHYLDYDSARRIDDRTRRAIEALDTAGIGFDQACGRVPIGGLLTVARRRGLAVETVDLRNSGDTAGPRGGVVGYGAWAFVEPAGAEESKHPFERHPGELLSLARQSIRFGLSAGTALPVDVAALPEPLRAHGAAFVTLKRAGELRGCIGSPQAYRPLAADVAENAYAAAFHDPRFPALAEAELEGLSVSLSVLTPAQPLAFADETELLDQLRPRQDGLIIQKGGRRALFLPAVWEQLPDPELFLGHLKQKAGLSPGDDLGGLRAWRFAAVEVKD